MEQVKAQASRSKTGTRETNAKAEAGGNIAPPAWAQDPGGEEAAGSTPTSETPSVSAAAPADAQSVEVGRGKQAEAAPRPESTAPQPRYS